MCVYFFWLGLRFCTWAFSNCSKQGLRSSCGVWASHWGGFSCCWAWALGYVGLVVACGLWNVNSAAVSHRLHCPLACGVLSDQGSNQCPLHCKVNNFWGTSILLSIVVAVPIYFPSNLTLGFPFPYILVNTYHLLSFDNKHSEVLIINIMRWSFIMFVISQVEHLFMVLLTICMSLWNNIYSGLLPIF